MVFSILYKGLSAVCNLLSVADFKVSFTVAKQDSHLTYNIIITLEFYDVLIYSPLLFLRRLFSLSLKNLYILCFDWQHICCCSR